MKNFEVPQKGKVSETNQVIFENLEKGIGFVPNLYAAFTHSENALSTYIALQNSKTSLKAKEKEVVNLVVSQFNNCLYCLSAHTAIAKMNGFTDEQIIGIRKADLSFDSKLDALAKVVKSIAENKGKISDELKENFFSEGYTEGSLVDVIVLTGDKIITNYLFAATEVPIDWPLAKEI